MAKDPIHEQTVPTKKLAYQLAEILGCTGIHKVGEEWGPCESPLHLEKLIELGNPEFREWAARRRRKKSIEEFLELKAHTKRYRFSTQQEAEEAAKPLGCSGAHMNGQGVWQPCATPEELNAAVSNAGPGRSRIIRAQRPARRVITQRRVWERLRERGPRGIETLPGGGLVSGKAMGASDSFRPSSGLISEAKKGLEWRREYGRGGTAVGVARARDISNGKSLSYDTVKRMKAFFDRHQSDSRADGYRPGEAGYPSNGRIAWALWGGDAGYSWAKKIVRSVEGTEKSIAYMETKRYYTGERRDEYAKRGYAMEDGSFPIRDVGDLRNAIQAHGRARDVAAARRHIIKRARALGRTDLIPDSWKKRKRRQ